MAGDEQYQYDMLQKLASAATRQTPFMNAKDWAKARERVAEYARTGKRLDGAPATASIYGVVRKQENVDAPAESVTMPEESEKERQRRAFMEELAQMKREREERYAAGSDGEADDRGKPEGDAGQADAKAGADGLRPKAAGRDCERRNANRRGAKAAGVGKRAGADRTQTGSHGVQRIDDGIREKVFEAYAQGMTYEQVHEQFGIARGSVANIIAQKLTELPEKEQRKYRRRNGKITPELREEIYQLYKSGKSSKEVAKCVGTCYQTVLEILHEEAAARGEKNVVRAAGRQERQGPHLTPEQRSEMFDEYAAGAHVKNMLKKWRISDHYMRKELHAEAKKRGVELLWHKEAGVRNTLTPEQRAAVFDEYARTEACAREIGERFGLSHDQIMKVIEDEARRRGVERPERKMGGRQRALTDEQRAQLYEEYMTTPISQAQLGKKWYLSETGVYRYIREERAARGTEERTKPGQDKPATAPPERQVSEKPPVKSQSIVRQEELVAKVYPNFARWLRESGMTLMKLTKLLHIDPHTIRQWLRGGSENWLTKPRIDKLMEMSGQGYYELFATKENVGGGKTLI